MQPLHHAALFETLALCEAPVRFVSANGKKALHNSGGANFLCAADDCVVARRGRAHPRSGRFRLSRGCGRPTYAPGSMPARLAAKKRA